MKKFFAIVGTIISLAIPLRASAATEAISDAVNQVLDRSRAAVVASRSTGLEKVAVGAIPDFLRQALSTVLVRVTTKTSVVEQQRSLAERSTCFRYDLWLIERETDNVWRELDEAEVRGDVVAILRLQDVLSFLSNQYDELLAGGLHPERQDASWQIPMLTEDEDDEAEDATPLCFFHSSYTPPNEAGYGCGLSELDRILTALPAEKSEFRTAVTRERDALAQTQAATESIRRASNGLDRLQQSIDVLIAGGTVSSSSSSSETSSQAFSSSSAVTAGTPAVIQGCVKTLDDGVIMREVRGPFAVIAQDWRLLRDFWELRNNEAENRPLPDGLELSPKADQFSDVDLTQARDAMREFAANQAEEESAMFAAAVDPGLALENVFADLRSATSLLTKLGGSTDEGLPMFVRNFTYWLRRSCTDRTACDERLDSILKFTFTPACFPYGNGDYEESTCEQPQWKKCLYGALHPGDAIPDEPGCAESSSSSL
jgi:hypothetical protein